MTRPATSPVPTPPAAASAINAGTDGATVEPALVDGVDVDAIARAVRACAGVADLYSGRFGEIGSYLPGRRIGGVQVDDTAVTVHIRARWGYGVRDLLVQVSALTVALRNGRRLDLVVDDIDDELTGTAESAVDAVTAVAPPLAIEAATPIVETASPTNLLPPESSTS